jgi:hypothetical protein
MSKGVSECLKSSKLSLSWLVRHLLEGWSFPLFLKIGDFSSNRPADTFTVRNNKEIFVKLEWLEAVTLPSWPLLRLATCTKINN